MLSFFSTETYVYEYLDVLVCLLLIMLLCMSHHVNCSYFDTFSSWGILPKSIWPCAGRIFLPSMLSKFPLYLVTWILARHIPYDYQVLRIFYNAVY